MTREVLSEFSELIRKKRCNPFSGMLRTGADLGTANIVIAVANENNHLVVGATTISKIVEDGIVVDFVGAMQIVRHLKVQLEELFGVPLETAATAVPPRIVEGSVGCITNVMKGVEFKTIRVIDELTAATLVSGIRDGAVVGVGGGATGISALKDKKVIFTADEPTGGAHMTLILAEYYGISIEEAEKLKTNEDRERDIFLIIKSVAEKMASIVRGFLSGYEVDCVYVVGGASCFSGFEHTFEKALGIETVKTNNTLLVTPLGVTWNVSTGPV